MVNIQPLQRAVKRLQEGWALYEQNKNMTIIRDGLIQRFEFTYELSHKTLKRYLEQTSPSADEYDMMVFQDLIRTGNERGLLLGDWLAWKKYRDMRSKTSHTYDEDVALVVVSGIPAFLQEVEFLLQQLQRRLDDGQEVE